MTSNLKNEWSITNGILPTGLTLDNETGEISGTPTESGSFDITVKVENACGEATKVINIGSCAKPVITSGDIEFVVGESSSETLTYTGSTPGTWSIVLGILPNGLSLNSTTGEISGTSTQTGSFNIIFKVTNACGEATKTIHISVQITSSTSVFTASQTSINPGTNGGETDITIVSQVDDIDVGWTYEFDSIPTWYYVTKTNNTLSIVIDRNQTPNVRTDTFRLVQTSTGDIINITLTQATPDSIFVIDGVHNIFKLHYSPVTDAILDVQSEWLVDNSDIAWDIDPASLAELSSISSWFTLTKVGKTIKYSLLSHSTLNPTVEVKLIQQVTNDVINISIISSRAVQGLSVTEYNGRIFVAASDGVYREGDDGVFRKTNLHTSNYAYGSIFTLNNILYTTVFVAQNYVFSTVTNSWSSNSGVSGSGRDGKQIYYWDDISGMFIPVKDVNGNDMNNTNGYNGYYNLKLITDDYAVIAKRVASSQSRLDLLSKNNPFRMSVMDSNSLSTATQLWTSMPDTSDTNVFYGDRNGLLYKYTINNTMTTITLGSAIMSGLSVTHPTYGIIPINQSLTNSLILASNGYYYIGLYYMSNRWGPNAGVGTSGYLRKFKINMTTGTAYDITNIRIPGDEIVSSNGNSVLPPSQGALCPFLGQMLELNDKLYIPLNGSRYVCAVLDLSDDSIELVPWYDDNKIMSFAYPITDGHSVYFMNTAVNWYGMTGADTITTLGSRYVAAGLGVVKVIPETNSYRVERTPINYGIYQNPVYIGNSIYIPGDGLSLKYDTQHFNATVVRYE